MADESVVQCAGAIMDTFHMMIRTVGVVARRSSTEELSMPQFRAMKTIQRYEDTSVSLVAERLGNTLSAASRLVEGLVEKGYVCRETAGDDRRRLVLGLTDSGEQAIERVHLQTVACLAEKLDTLTPSECGILNLAMDLLRSKIASSQQADAHTRLPIKDDSGKRSTSKSES